MKKLLLSIALSVFAAAPAFAGTFVSDYQCTKDTAVGRGFYGSDSNYGSLIFSRVAKEEGDSLIMDFDRAAMLTWVNTTVQAQPNGAGISITDVNQILNGALTMSLVVTTYGGAWEETNTPPPTKFGHYFWPVVRVAENQDGWGEMTATFNNAN